MLRADSEHRNPFVERFIIREVTFGPFVQGDDPVVNLFIHIQGTSVNPLGISSPGMLSLPIQIRLC